MADAQGAAPAPVAQLPPAKRRNFPSGQIVKITDHFESDDDEQGEEYWIQFRPMKERFKGGERAAIYAYLDEVEGGQATKTLMLARRIALHVVHSWSLDLPVPRPIITAGKVTGYDNVDVLDQLDTEVEDWILLYAKIWMEKIAINFAANPDPESPTKPSGE